MCFVIAPHKSANGVYHYLIKAKQTVMLIRKLIKAFHFYQGIFHSESQPCSFSIYLLLDLTFLVKPKNKCSESLKPLHSTLLFSSPVFCLRNHSFKSQVVLGACFKRLISKKT